MSSTLRFYYHWSPLKLTEEQTIILETYFGLSRMVSNFLLSLTNGMSDNVAKTWDPSIRELEAKVLGMMNSTDHPPMMKMQPALLRNLLTAWLSEWQDWRSGRTHKPTFRQGRQAQTLWLLDKDLVTYRQDAFCINEEGIEMSLLPPKIGVPKHATAFVVGREAVNTSTSRYWMAALLEHSALGSKIDRDPIIGQWGLKLSQLDRSVGKMADHEEVVQCGCEMMRLRKLILHRMLRQKTAIIEETRLLTVEEGEIHE